MNYEKKISCRYNVNNKKKEEKFYSRNVAGILFSLSLSLSLSFSICVSPTTFRLSFMTELKTVE
jgi:hypothetical protein